MGEGLREWRKETRRDIMGRRQAEEEDEVGKAGIEKADCKGDIRRVRR